MGGVLWCGRFGEGGREWQLGDEVEVGPPWGSFGEDRASTEDLQQRR